jgi:hypothetical protein
MPTIKSKKNAKQFELQSLLSKEELDRQIHRLPVPLPSAPDMFVNGLNPELQKCLNLHCIQTC